MTGIDHDHSAKFRLLSVRNRHNRTWAGPIWVGTTSAATELMMKPGTTNVNARNNVAKLSIVMNRPPRELMD